MLTWVPALLFEEMLLTWVLDFKELCLPDAYPQGHGHALLLWELEYGRGIECECRRKARCMTCTLFIVHNDAGWTSRGSAIISNGNELRTKPRETIQGCSEGVFASTSWPSVPLSALDPDSTGYCVQEYHQSFQSADCCRLKVISCSVA